MRNIVVQTLNSNIHPQIIMLNTDFIKLIQSFIADGKTDEALTLLRQEAAANYLTLLNDVTLIENRYQTAHNDFIIRGILTKEEYDNRVAKINLAVLELLNKADAIGKLPETSSVPIQKSNGRLLHNIPEQMPLQKDSKCVVRIAFDDDIIKRDLPTTSDTVIQSIRITEVMSVSLVDFNETPCFVIRTITEAEQFIDTGDYTQWIFMVKPLKSGHYPLTLKVTVMEKIDGKERKRDIVLEKEIYILSQVADEDGKTASGNNFTDTNIVLSVVAQKQLGASDNKSKKGDIDLLSNTPNSPGAPIAQPNTQKVFVQSGPPLPAPTEVKSSRSLTTVITSVLAVLLVAGAGLWVTTKSTLSSQRPDVATTRVDTLNINKNDLPKQTSKDTDILAQNLPKDSETNAVKQPNPPTIIKDKPIKNTKSDDSKIASGKPRHKNKDTPVNPVPTTGNEPSEVIMAMRKYPNTPATEKLPNIVYAEPTVILADKITKDGAPTVKIMRPLLIKLNNGAKLKDVQIFVDGQLVKPNVNVAGIPVSMTIISHNGPHNVLLKKGNKSCEYVDVLMINDIATIEGCNLD